MAQGSLTIKLDNETKKEFNEFCEEIGINMTTAINMFIKKVIREQRIPFELSLNKPNLETLQAIHVWCIIKMKKLPFKKLLF